jgi:hypothetical protein
MGVNDGSNGIGRIVETIDKLEAEGEPQGNEQENYTARRKTFSEKMQTQSSLPRGTRARLLSAAAQAADC